MKESTNSLQFKERRQKFHSSVESLLRVVTQDAHSLGK